MCFCGYIKPLSAVLESHIFEIKWCGNNWSDSFLYMNFHAVSVYDLQSRYSSVRNSGELHIEPKLVHYIFGLYQFKCLFSESLCLFESL
jgi:hypothetical protein